MDGTYIFVAKQSIVESSYEQIHLDFKKILSKANTFVELVS
jgi:hypothetical protein